ncbi:MAG: hypothetical protein JWO30_4778 [Fibrobacteres bacterium]|nr:hypothetical protein [Fibrobacterota bacterium]
MSPIDFRQGPRRSGSRARTGVPGFRLLPAALAFLAALLSACVNAPDQSETYFRLEADPDLVTYHRITIQLADSLGNLQATLYDDSLPTLDRLIRLPAGPYRGGTARITILAYRGDRLAYRETRLYDGEIQQIISVEVFLVDPASPDPETVLAKPGGHAPTFAVFPGDTLVTLRDSVPLNSEVVDQDGDLAGYTWDCDGDGHPEDSASLPGDYRSKIRFGRAYPDSGTHFCILKVWDKAGASVQGKVRIRVITDPPAARAGNDTTVVVESAIHLHAMGEDGMGPIVSREWKIGGTDFKPVTQQETSIQAPASPGDLLCVLRVTDSDSLTSLDTLRVKVIYSPDNTLSDLRTNIGGLEPAFRKDVRHYLVTLGQADSLLTITPKVSEPHARVTVEAADASGAVPVALGENSFTVGVTAQDGSTLQYSVTVRREGTR